MRAAGLERDIRRSTIPRKVLAHRRTGVQDDSFSAELFPQFLGESFGGLKNQVDCFLGRFQRSARGHGERGIDHVSLHGREKLITHMAGGEQGEGQDHDAEGDTRGGVSPFDAEPQGIAIANH